MLVATPVRAVVGALIIAEWLGGPTGAPPARTRAPAEHTLVTSQERVGPVTGAPVAWAQHLEPVLVEAGNTGARASLRLYRDDGEVDDDAVARFVETVSEKEDAHALIARTIQLAFKAAYHFKAKKMTVVSAWRPGRGPHGDGSALDFRLTGVNAGVLAAYLRHMPRAGVGIYTNPRTQYVHLDARKQSFHWLDASPPGKTWREKGLVDPKRDQRDASWTPESDLPATP